VDQARNREPEDNGNSIVNIEVSLLRIPLNNPVQIAIAEIPFREYNIVKVTTRDGIVGTGYARGGSIVDVALREYLSPAVLGMNGDQIEAIWDYAYRLTIQVGRRGAVLRAMSALDIALWDVRARRAGLPLWRLLGGTRKHVPCYASGGYYGKGRGLSDLAVEIESYVERGFNAVKVKVGGAELAVDRQRVELVRGIVGESATVMVDANTGFDGDRDAALEMALCLRDSGVRFFEEPFGPDRLGDLAWLREKSILPIASGEQESTRWGFEQLLGMNSVDVAQPDVTVVGGVSEWLKVAEMTQAMDIPLAPHYFPEVHAQLAGAVPTTEWVEYFTRDIDIVNFDDVLTDPLAPKNGLIELSEQPGVGIDLDTSAAAKYRVR